MINNTIFISRKTARAVPKVLALIAATTVVAGSSAMNGMFGFELAKGLALPIQIVTVAVIVGIDWLKPFAPGYIARARTAGDLTRARTGQFGLVLAILLSTAAAIGFSANLRANATAERQSAIAAHDRAKASFKAAVAELETLRGVRSATEIKAEIDAILLDPRSDGCRKINGPYTRKWCPAVARLRIEMAKADRRVELVARRDRAARTMEAAPAIEADPQATRIAWLISFVTPVSAEAVQNALVILAAIGVEFFAAFGFELAGRRREGEKDTAPADALPAELARLYRHLALHRDTATGQACIRQDEVGRALGISKSTVNMRLSALIDAGILRKISADRRGTLLELIE